MPLAGRYAVLPFFAEVNTEMDFTVVTMTTRHNNRFDHEGEVDLLAAYIGSGQIARLGSLSSEPVWAWEVDYEFHSPIPLPTPWYPNNRHFPYIGRFRRVPETSDHWAAVVHGGVSEILEMPSQMNPEESVSGRAASILLLDESKSLSLKFKLREIAFPEADGDIANLFTFDEQRSLVGDDHNLELRNVHMPTKTAYIPSDPYNLVLVSYVTTLGGTTNDFEVPRLLNYFDIVSGDLSSPVAQWEPLVTCPQGSPKAGCELLAACMDVKVSGPTTFARIIFSYAGAMMIEDASLGTLYSNDDVYHEVIDRDLESIVLDCTSHGGCCEGSVAYQVTCNCLVFSGPSSRACPHRLYGPDTGGFSPVSSRRAYIGLVVQFVVPMATVDGDVIRLVIVDADSPNHDDWEGCTVSECDEHLHCVHAEWFPSSRHRLENFDSLIWQGFPVDELPETCRYGNARLELHFDLSGSMSVSRFQYFDTSPVTIMVDVDASTGTAVQIQELVEVSRIPLLCHQDPLSDDLYATYRSVNRLPDRIGDGIMSSQESAGSFLPPWNPISNVFVESSFAPRDGQREPDYPEHHVRPLWTDVDTQQTGQLILLTGSFDSTIDTRMSETTGASMEYESRPGSTLGSLMVYSKVSSPEWYSTRFGRVWATDVLVIADNSFMVGLGGYSTLLGSSLTPDNGYVVCFERTCECSLVLPAPEY